VDVPLFAGVLIVIVCNPGKVDLVFVTPSFIVFDSVCVNNLATGTFQVFVRLFLLA
jgi:hypothetical protein